MLARSTSQSGTTRHRTTNARLSRRRCMSPWSPSTGRTRGRMGRSGRSRSIRLYGDSFEWRPAGCARQRCRQCAHRERERNGAVHKQGQMVGVRRCGDDDAAEHQGDRRDAGPAPHRERADRDGAAPISTRAVSVGRQGCYLVADAPAPQHPVTQDDRGSRSTAPPVCPQYPERASSVAASGCQECRNSAAARDSDGRTT